jgi:Ankyrin repeats (3 copies)/Leucine rich repeat/Ankyrin repeat
MRPYSPALHRGLCSPYPFWLAYLNISRTLTTPLTYSSYARLLPASSIYVLLALSLALAPPTQVIMLLDHGADVNSLTFEGESPLYLAVRGTHLDLVKLLIRRGAHVRVNEDTVFPSALHIAAVVGSAEICTTLLRNQASVDALLVDSDRAYTPLILAADRGHQSCASVLLDAGADVNKRDRTGGVGSTGSGARTALHFAAESGSLATVRLLVAHGAQLCEEEVPEPQPSLEHSSTKKGARHRPLPLANAEQLARQRHHSEVASFLRAEQRLRSTPPDAEQLDLSHCGLTEVPDSVMERTSLVHLNLRHNQLDSLPPALATLPNLRNLELEGNPLRLLPIEVVQRGLENVLLFLKSLDKSSHRWNSVKVRVFGGVLGVQCLSSVLRLEWSVLLGVRAC